MKITITAANFWRHSHYSKRKHAANIPPEEKENKHIGQFKISLLYFEQWQKNIMIKKKFSLARTLAAVSRSQKRTQKKTKTKSAHEK